MTNETSDKDFLEFIVKSLVDNPDSVEIDRKVDEMGVLLTLKVHADDMGQIIGKGGSTAKAIRDLVRTIGLKSKARVNLKIVEPEGSTYKPREESSENKTEGLEDIKL